MIFLDQQPITLEKLSQIKDNLVYQIYPIQEIVLDDIDTAGNLYFITKEGKA